MALPAGFGVATRGRPDAARPPHGEDARERVSRNAADIGASDNERVAPAREAAARLEDAVARWGDTVYGLAARRTGNRADAEDVLQTVFLRLHQSGKRFRDDEHLKAWLLHVTVNCCHDLRRSPWHKRRAELDDESMERLSAQPEAETGEERDDELEAALARLTVKQRTAVLLHYYEGYATDEIAQITGERPATVRSHLHRARKALKIDLGAHL
ncbi:sigma-70 family RNA polymerase sigma factor [Gordonibacter sp. 28C]|nr:sigma-70 family RNA polymerase sigma factor [Gordonibacter sp. 28C]